MALIEARPRMRVVDLGCGTGELTRALHEHLLAEETLGIDSSETMLLKDRNFHSESRPPLRKSAALRCSKKPAG
ncbi:MAG TPA: methyltransferase domain-containing protein [Thermoanaerobaculia bacterium]|nr:methyltransferase domain-containing protein [Thermoanaerobaculia bacterium]